MIVPGLPTIFPQFRGKRFNLLWRGGRDGFGAADFHGRCDGHANTLSIIQDTNANVFGGFTPVKWSSDGGFCTDESLRSFLFTLKNPHNMTASRFQLKSSVKDKAILCADIWGPHFRDIAIADHGNENNENLAAGFGYAYSNDLGLGGNPPQNTFLTGAKRFKVWEIEVFEIIG
jgi:hypothetical protein